MLSGWEVLQSSKKVREEVDSCAVEGAVVLQSSDVASGSGKEIVSSEDL